MYFKTHSGNKVSQSQSHFDLQKSTKLVFFYIHNFAHLWLHHVKCYMQGDQPSEIPSKLSLHREKRRVLSGLP